MKDILIVGLVGLLWELVSSDGGELITIVLFALLVGTAIARTPRARDIVVICGVGLSWQTMLADSRDGVTIALFVLPPFRLFLDTLASQQTTTTGFSRRVAWISVNPGRLQQWLLKGFVGMGRRIKLRSGSDAPCCHGIPHCGARTDAGTAHIITCPGLRGHGAGQRSSRSACRVVVRDRRRGGLLRASQEVEGPQLHCSDQVPCTCCHRRWDPDACVLAAGWRAAITMTGDGAASHGNGAGEPRRCSRPSRPSIGSRSTNGSMPGRHAVTFRPTGKTGNRNLRKSAAVLLAGARRVGEYEPASIGGSGVWFRAVPSAVALRALADGSAAHTI